MTLIYTIASGGGIVLLTIKHNCRYTSMQKRLLLT